MWAAACPHLQALHLRHRARRSPSHRPVRCQLKVLRHCARPDGLPRVDPLPRRARGSARPPSPSLRLPSPPSPRRRHGREGAAAQPGDAEAAPPATEPRAAAAWRLCPGPARAPVPAPAGPRLTVMLQCSVSGGAGAGLPGGRARNWQCSSSSFQLTMRNRSWFLWKMDARNFSSALSPDTDILASSPAAGSRARAAVTAGRWRGRAPGPWGAGTAGGQPGRRAATAFVTDSAG